MLKKAFRIIIGCALIAAATSCTHTVYPTKTLYTNYAVKMSSDKELEIKSKVKIFLSENDIKGNYEVISLNTYKPFCFISAFSIPKKKLQKKFFEAAVKKAYEEGGNAVLISSAIGGVGQFKVLNLKDWNSDDEKTSEYMNVIFDTENMSLFESGKLLDSKRGVRVRAEKSYIQEIEVNLQIVRESKEVEMVRKKIEVLDTYGKSRNDKDISKIATKYSKKLTKIEKRIAKKQAKMQANQNK